MISHFKKSAKKTPSRPIFLYVLLGIFVLTIVGFLIISNYKINQRRTELRSQIEVLKKEIQILEEKRQKLQAGISESQAEGYLEKKAREDLGLKKPGEEVIVVLPPTEGKNEEDKEKKNFWQKLLDPVRNLFRDL